MGFQVPIKNWLRNELRDWADSLLDEKNLKEQGFNNKVIRKIWNDHLSCKGDWSSYLWSVLSWQAWLQNEK